MEEVSKHRQQDDFWIAVDGAVYDISNFVKHHPGGSIINCSGGTDATVLYHTYHIENKNKVEGVLKKYQIGKLTESSPQMGQFYKELCKAVAIKLQTLDRKPFLCKVLFFFDLLCYITFLCISFNLNNETPVLFVFLVWFCYFGVSANRCQQQIHALGHMQLFSKSMTTFLDLFANMVGVVTTFTFSSNMNGNIRSKNHTKRCEAQYEFFTNRGPYEHQAIHHVEGGSLEHDQCYRSVSRNGMFRFRAIDVPKKWHSFQTHRWYQLLCDFVMHALTFTANPLLRLYATKIYWCNGDYTYAICCASSIIPTLVAARLLLLLPFHSYIGFYLFLVGEGLISAFSLSSSHGLYFFAQHIWDKVFDEDLVHKDWGKYNAESTYSYRPKEPWHPLFWFSGDSCPSTLSYHLEHTLFPGINYLNLPKIAPIVEQYCAKYSIQYEKVEGYEAIWQKKHEMIKKYQNFGDKKEK